jgi:signal transduction histidine kinase/CheY-like chemotaxis protein
MDPAGDGRFESQHQIQCTLGPRVRHVHALGQGFFEGEGRRRKAVRIVGTALDVTERVVAEREREALLASERRARLEAERAGRVRDEFLATLGHELRTPLNAVMGWTQVLRLKHGGDTALLEGLAVIERNARAQAQIIEDLLDMSRIVSGKVRIDVRPLELAEVVAAALETIRPAADAKRVALSFVRDDVPVRISGDPNRLQQVVWNLLSNAVKFTPSGGRVDVALRRVADAVELEVADTGRGMEAEFLPQLFQRFSQADSSTTRRFGGLGLGLAIVKQLVEMHGGTVRAESAGADRGATFTVTFAALDGPGAARPQGETAGDRRDDAAAPPRGELSGARVLVVEDDRDAREFTAHLLREWGAQVRTASSAGEAIAALRRELPDLVISDIGMPGEDGYVLMRTIRQWPAGQGGRLPAIALTAYARAEDRTQALQAGYDFHLPKPVEPSELLAACSALLARSGRQAAAVQ